MMKRIVALVVFIVAAYTGKAQQGYVMEGESTGGMFPYVHGGVNFNEGATGVMGGVGIKTYGRNYAPLGGQIELNYINTTIQNDLGLTQQGSLIDFNFMAAVTKFRKHLNYHMALGPAIMFEMNNGFGLYNFYPKVEGGIGYGKFMLKAAGNFSLNSNSTSMFNFTLAFYPNRKLVRTE
jgi:hypothetical protein